MLAEQVAEKERKKKEEEERRRQEEERDNRADPSRAGRRGSKTGGSQAGGRS